jgi:hypothetical protein
MDNIVLPKEIGYSPSLPSLPECNSLEVVLAPVNGSEFQANSMIIFDLPSRGYLDPQSVYLRYKYTISDSSTNTSAIRGTPIYSFFNKLETVFGSTVVESINNYGQICNMMTNLQLSIADKYGQQTAYGWSHTGSTPTLLDMDGRYCGNNEVNTLAAPLPCILSMSEKLIPLELMPNVRIQLSVDSIANIFAAISGTSVQPSSFKLSNVELCYSSVNFTGGVTDMVKNMGDPFYIKTTSWKNMGASLATGVNGSIDLVYNLRLASVKSLFAHFVGQTASKAINGLYDSFDVTSGNGEYSFNIAGVSYPSRPVSTLNSKAAFLMELKKACGALHSTSYQSSISTQEFSVLDSATATTLTTPAKFFFGVNTEKLSSNGALLTGISTQSSPISLRISTNTATTQAYNVYLLAMYDALIAVNPHDRSASVKE